MRFVKEGTIFNLSNNNLSENFVVTEILGVGGSCVAYKVMYYENGDIPHTGILKEYCPAFLEKNFFRTGIKLNIPETLKERFHNGLTEFKNTYKYINEYLSNNLTATNFHTVQLGLFEDNNTAYTLTSCDYGMSYDKIGDKNLLSIFKIMLSVTKAVELYHNAGFLHLDIKPKNILVLNEVTDLIKLFDFDSLTSIEKLKKREVQGIPVPEDYYVPELDDCQFRDIGIETDIYEIGAMLFLRLFKRAPKVSDMSFDSKFDFDESEFFTGTSPQVKSEIEELLKNTLQISKRKRYKTTEKLKSKLEKIISLLSDEKPYLLNLPKWQPSKHCIGRTWELKEIKERLNKDGYVFVKGIGGLGKSEISKLFARIYAEEYHTVQFCKYTDDLKTLVASLQINGVDEQNFGKFDDLVKEKNKILHLCDGKTLIIVDNFNVTYDDFLREFLPSDNKSFKVIFTTRCTMASEYYESKTFELGKLAMDECKSLFYSHCAAKKDNLDDELLETVIDYIDRNTLILILTANAIKKSGISLEDMFASFEEQTIVDLEARFFHEYDFSSEEVSAYNKLYAHLKTIFSISNLTDKQKIILKNITLISSNGIKTAEFIEHCASEKINEESVSEITALGWADEDGNAVISMHPIISDLLAIDESLIKDESYECLCEYLEDYCVPDLEHISVILNKLACAKHLERRYIFEDDFKKTIISVNLGRIYHCLYQPINAKKYLNKALESAEDTESIAMIYQFLGDAQKDFGLQSKAVEYYKKSLAEGELLDESFCWLNVESLISIAECYADNHDYIEAYEAYLEALKYSKNHAVDEYIYDIASALASVCEELEWNDKRSKCLQVAAKYKKISQPENEVPELSELIDLIENGNYTEGLKAYANFLARQRELLGEESPKYKDLKAGLWSFFAINNQKEQALFLLNESLEFIKSTSGENSIEMADMLAYASKLLVELLEFETAELFGKRALKICEELEDKHTYTFVEASFALANLYIVLGDLEEAMKYVGFVDFKEYSGNEFHSDIVRTAGIVLVQLSKFEIIEPLCIDLINRHNADRIGKFQAYILLSVISDQKGLFYEAEHYAKEAEKQISFIQTQSIKNEWLVQYYRCCANIQYRRANYHEAINIIDRFLENILEENRRIPVISSLYSDQGLFYQGLGMFDKAEEVYRKYEKILKTNNFPDKAFCILYNNMATNYEKMCDYKKAKTYLEKIVRAKPSVLSPMTYFEGKVCSNIGWIELKLGNFEKAIQIFKTVIRLFAKLKLTKSKDFTYILNNLAVAYAENENYDRALFYYKKEKEYYDHSLDLNGEIAIYITNGITYCLLNLEKACEAYNFACEEIKNYEQWFGKVSPIRVEAVLNIGGIFREHGFKDCEEFFLFADDLINESRDFKSVNYARALNYLGICETDYHQRYYSAEEFFIKSKELFEELNETENDMYLSVLHNIEYIEDMVFDVFVKNVKSNIEE